MTSDDSTTDHESNSEPETKKAQPIIKRLRFSNKHLLAFALVFGMLGAYTIWRTLAAGPTLVSLQAESMSLASGAQVVTDSSASGGKGVQFTQASRASGSVNLPSAAESMTLIAKAVKCKNAWPTMTVSVDNTTLLNTAVNSTTWRTFQINQRLESGARQVVITSTNPAKGNCRATLTVDVMTFYGPVISVTPPTITLNANPASITSGQSSTLTWSSTNATSCIASGGWSGDRATSGSAAVGPLSSTTTYTLTCNGAGGSASASKTVTVSGMTTPAPTSTSTGLGVLRINPNEPIPSDLSRIQLLILDATRGDQIAGLKAKYPNLKVIGYKNLTFAVSYSTDPIKGNAGVPWSVAQAHPDWFLLDSAGNRVASAGYPQAWMVDPASTSYQEIWYDTVLNFLKSSPWDGVFIDDVNADQGYHVGGDYTKLVKYPSMNSYRAAVRTMLAATAPRLKSAGYLVIPNIGARWDQPDVWADWAGLASGAMREHFLKWGSSTEPVLTGADWKIHTDVIKAVQGANRTFVGVTYGPTTDIARQTYIRASFLLFWDPSLNSVVAWNVNEDSSFRSDIGKPTAAAVQNGSIWTRTFERGSVRVDTAAGTGTITNQ